MVTFRIERGAFDHLYCCGDDFRCFVVLSWLPEHWFYPPVVDSMLVKLQQHGTRSPAAVLTSLYPEGDRPELEKALDALAALQLMGDD
jgi:hypothetical protein